MKKLILFGCSLLTASAALGQYASQSFLPVKLTDRTVYFCNDAPGEYLPILWGLDTAWPDEANMRRGVRFIGAENIGVARVSFQPWDFMLNTTKLTPKLEKNLDERLRLVSYIGGPDKVKLILNNDAPGDQYDRRYANPASDANALTAYCNLIYGTTIACQEKGWEVITASPLNEPDYIWNEQGSMDDFLAIARKLKTEYPQYKTGDIRISGGNTLNCDQAKPWYDYLSEYIDEGNTHQLAGDFNHYADFFAYVRADGKYATADELHNVMEAMVGVEYGMQTGIWWGTAEYARGEFCRASFGKRLAYSENRYAWTSAAVYRAPDGKVQGFVGSSERQAKPCTYRFVSQDRDVFFNGHGPQREYLVSMPGGSGYQDGQTNAECVVDITWGEDVSPVIDGKYLIMNKFSEKLMAIKGAPDNLSEVKQYSNTQSSTNIWEVKPVPITIGGDFSYYTITLAQKPSMKFDVINWSLEDNAQIILYDGGLGGNEQWYLKYAGDGYFRIFSRHSNLCLQLAQESKNEGIQVVQATPSDSPAQLWRFVPSNVMCETKAPLAPTDLKATGQSASIYLQWTRSTSGDAASYTILRAESGSNEFNTIGRGVNYAFFVDNTVVPGKSYDYKIKCLDRAGNSSVTTDIVTCSTQAHYDLIARYMFDGSLADATNNHFDAMTNVEQTATYGAGHVDGTKSLEMATNRFIQLPYQIANNEEMTFSTWIYWKSKGFKQCVFDFGSDDSHNMALHLNTNGNLVLTLNNGDVQQTVEGTALPTNTWSHVTVTVRASRAAIFIDGALVGEGTLAYGLTPAQIGCTTNYIGRTQLQEGSPIFSALLQDMRIYNYAVGDSKIPTLMDNDINSIDNVMVEEDIIAVEYYNLSGMRVEMPSHGLYIRKAITSDGRIITSKVRLQ